MSKRKTKILEYNIVFTPEDEGGYSAYVPDLPGCVSQGDTFEEAKSNIKEAIQLYLESEDNELFEMTPEETRKQFTTAIQVNG